MSPKRNFKKIKINQIPNQAENDGNARCVILTKLSLALRRRESKF
jgi:hypothetical protein